MNQVVQLSRNKKCKSNEMFKQKKLKDDKRAFMSLHANKVEINENRQVGGKIGGTSKRFTDCYFWLEFGWHWVTMDRHRHWTQGK